MRKCWCEDSRSRPHFKEILAAIQPEKNLISQTSVNPYSAVKF